MNEKVIAQVHELESRTFQVELRRDSQQQVWGLTWARAAFNAQRRVLEGVVPASPAGRANRERTEAGERPLQPGDELVAVNGMRGWEAMGCIRGLLHARLTFLRDASEPSVAAQTPGSAVYMPPPFSQGGYTLDAGSGWWGHAGAQWLFNDVERVYFHVPTGGLFMEDASAPGSFVCISPQGAAADAKGEAPAPRTSRLRGRVRWFGRAKGFGFIAPWPQEGAAAGGATSSSDPAKDVFVHRKQLLLGAEGPEAEPLPLVPGMPVLYSLAAQEDGKPCAEGVCPEVDLAGLCDAGFSLGPAARSIERASVELKVHCGQAAAGAFAGITTGCRGMGGAEYVALHLPRDVVSHFKGREQCGEKGARTALGAAFRQTQHDVLQYAQRLSDNSAGLWLAAETTACTAFVFGPDADGRPHAILTAVGGGRLLVGCRDGSVAAGLGSVSAGEDGAGRAPKRRCTEDSFKVFEKGLKGPPISFPQITPGVQPAPKGFGAHNWKEKDGATAGLQLEVHSHALDWEEDALLVLGSTAAWEALPEDEEVVRIALQSLREPGEGPPAQRAARRLMEATRSAKRKTAEDTAVAVLRLSWCAVEGEVQGSGAGGAGETGTSASTSCSVSLVAREAGGQTAASARRPSAAGGGAAGAQADDLDDMFAAPAAREAGSEGEPEDMFAAPSSPAPAPQELDDMFAAPAPAPQQELGHMLAAPAAAGAGPGGGLGQAAPGPADSGEAPGQGPCDLSADEPAAPLGEPMGPKCELDDMFADFCREIAAIHPGM